MKEGTARSGVWGAGCAFFLQNKVQLALGKTRYSLYALQPIQFVYVAVLTFEVIQV